MAVNTIGIVLGSMGILATFLVTWLVDRRTTKLLKRVEIIQTADMAPTNYLTLLRLIEDAERFGVKRASIYQKEDGSWGIKWEMGIGEGVKF